MKIIALLLAGMLCLSGCGSSSSTDGVNMEKNTIYLSAPDKGEMPDSGSEIPLLPDDSVPPAISQPVKEPVPPVSSSQAPVSSSQVAVSSSAPASSASASVAPSSSEATWTPSSSQAASSSSATSADKPTSTTPISTDEVRAVWISYLDFYTLARDKGEAEFTANIKKAFKEYQDYGLNTLFVQVRPFGDALYESNIVPYSHTLNSARKEGRDPGYDPLKIMVKEAKALGMTIEAWLNPYRIRNANTNVALSSDNPAKKMLNDGSRSVVEYDGIISFNPASTKAQDHIVAVVMEIIENYDVDGIHFDDYFYPTTAKAFDEKDYASYQSNGGKLSLGDWRRNNVSSLIKKVYNAIKAHDSNLLFGISPQANMNNNYNGQFVDIEMMVQKGGYMDYVCPQIYYGFENQTLPYDTTLVQWNTLVKGKNVALYVGLGPYKCGLEDTWAGTGKNEWIDNTDITKRMVETGRKVSDYAGFAIFRSELFFNPPAAQATHVNKERANLQKILD